LKKESILLAIAVGIASWLGSYFYYQPETIEIEIEKVIEKPVEVPIYIDREIKVVKEVLIQEPCTLVRPTVFKDLEALEEWLFTKESTYRIYIGDNDYTCMDYCAYMIREAALEGHLFNQEGFLRVNGSQKEAHVLCKTWVNDKWIFVEPQTYKIVEKDWN